MITELEDRAGPLLDALLDPSWMNRRKDSVTFGTESLLCRVHSFDFDIPEALVDRSNPSFPRATIPLGFWWKAPGHYTNIDFVDEAEDSLPLSTSSFDEDVTVAVLEEFASRILCKPITEIHLETTKGLVEIVRQDAIQARQEAKNTWLTPDPAVLACKLSNRAEHIAKGDGISEAEIGVLGQDKAFGELLEVCAMASVFTVVVHDRFTERRVIKLRYDEPCTGLRGTATFEKPRSSWQRIKDRLRAAALVFGLASYDVDIGNAFVRAERYHFEEDPPPGLRFAKVTSKLAQAASRKAKHQGPRVHIYESKGLGAATYLTVRGKLVVTDNWLNAAIVSVIAAIIVLFAIKENIEGLNPTSSQSVITIAVLVPTIATSIVWRRVHWLVVRLQRWLRHAFGFLGLLLFYVALRIAASPVKEVSCCAHHDGPGSDGTTERLVDGPQIADIATCVLLFSAAVLLILVVARGRSWLASRRALQPRLA